MLTRADLSAALENPYALALMIIIGAGICAFVIVAVADALWLRVGPTEPVEPIVLDDDVRTALDHLRGRQVVK